MTATPNEAHIGITESVFRQVNEGIAETAELFEADETEFVCECADLECKHRVEATLDEYEEVRSDGTHFLIVEGHEEPGFERVVKRRRGYAIVEKFRDRLAALVRRSNPRTP
jgi:hypothetical protein